MVEFVLNERDVDVFVIGDIHGCAEELDQLLAKLPLKRKSVVILLGDYIDRGPSSRDVLEILLKLSNRVKLLPLLGNHEASLLEFLEKPLSREAARFLYNGGGATLQSYSDEKGGYLIPKDHLEFIQSAQILFQCERYVFVHAGLPDLPLREIDEQLHRRDLLWIRKQFLESTYHWGKIVVHGHTPTPSVEFLPQRINLDTGCVYNNRLSAIHLQTKDVYQVPRINTSGLIYLKDDPASKRRAVRFTGEVDVQVQVGLQVLNFKTIDFNELGILIQPVVAEETPAFIPGEQLEGQIITAADESFKFSGRIVRMEQGQGTCKLGVEFYWPPERKT